MEKIYDVIIIGAGISGIGASLHLSKEGIEHLILEGRDRIGGRIHTEQYEGIPIHLGASFVHSPHKHENKIAEMVKKLHWKTIPANFQSEQYVHEDKGELGDKTIDRTDKIFEKLDEAIQEAVQNSETDISVAEAAEEFIANLKGKPELVDSVKFMLNIVANIQAADLHQLSAREYTQGEETESQHDYLPEGGYSKLLKAIYDLHKPELRLNQVVTKVDYSEDVVKLHTKDQVYQARKVISSLPIGVLQKGLVEFQPQLPEAHQEAIHKIGNGIANKLFITFEEAFWDQEKEWLYFVTKEPSRYPTAMMVTASQKPMLCVFVSGSASVEVSELSEEEILEDFVSFASKFHFKKKISAVSCYMTRWNKDPFSLGSYSYIKVGTTKEDIKTLKTPINNRLWFIGQHCHPISHACTQSAFQTGLWAAKEVTQSLQE